MNIGIDARIWSETTGRYVRNLVSGLAKIDKKNKYFILVMDYEAEKIKKQINLDSFEIIKTDIKWHTLKEQFMLAKVLHKYGLDLMHFTYFSIPINYSKPFIVTVHDLIIHHFLTGKASTLPFPVYFIKRLAYLRIIRSAAKRAEKIISVSNATRSEVVDHLGVGGDKVKVIYEGVDESLVIQGSKTDFEFPYLLYVGNAYPHKNLDRLAQAFEKVQKNNEKLILVGKENFFYKRLKNEFSKRGYKNIIFFGEATDKQLGALYKSAKAYVTPSLMEGFGLPPLEAMANGCFVIASDIPSLREICEDAPLYFDPYSLDDISDKIRFAFSDTDKMDYIKEGLRRSKSFSWERMAKKTLQVYEGSAGLRQNK